MHYGQNMNIRPLPVRTRLNSVRAPFRNAARTCPVALDGACPEALEGRGLMCHCRRTGALPWGEAHNSTASRPLPKPRLSVTRPLDKLLPNGERRSGAVLGGAGNTTALPFPLPSAPFPGAEGAGGWMAVPCFVALFLVGIAAGAADLGLGAPRLFNQGRDLRLLVLNPDTALAYEIQASTNLGAS